MYAGCTDTDPIDREADHCTGRQGIKELLAIVVDDADARLPVVLTRQPALFLGKLFSSSSAVLFAQMMFADQVYRTRLRSFFPEFFCEAQF
jgi:hypothetical protein